MELSDSVQKGLQYLADPVHFDLKTFTTFTDAAFQSLLSSQSECGLGKCCYRPSLCGGTSGAYATWHVERWGVKTPVSGIPSVSWRYIVAGTERLAQQNVAVYADVKPKTPVDGGTVSLLACMLTICITLLVLHLYGQFVSQLSDTECVKSSRMVKMCV